MSAILVFIALVCGHLASEVKSELVKNRTVFIGRLNFRGDLEMSNGKDRFFKARNLPTGDVDVIQKWVLQDESDYSPRVIGSMKEDRQKVRKEFHAYPFPYVYTTFDGQRHSRMHRENGEYVIVYLNHETPYSNATIGKSDFFGDWTFSHDGKTIVSFSRKWLSTLNKYAITMEPGHDIKDNFATFVMFFVLQHGNVTKWE
ncbi:hypothetical protein DdX_20634 [Ditylenchus destructor]|uniref:Uncharacterized protein n=1 Tax=Ditylenchus destructor TaxID=166010 RepID=A0AAD4MGW4_9BILA|nr:hypothetical protein DdX_20634 [Ditylenchus destructor]